VKNLHAQCRYMVVYLADLELVTSRLPVRCTVLVIATAVPQRYTVDRTIHFFAARLFTTYIVINMDFLSEINFYV